MNKWWKLAALAGATAATGGAAGVGPLAGLLGGAAPAAAGAAGAAEGAGLLATNPALIESAVGSAGYGASSAGAGATPSMWDGLLGGGKEGLKAAAGAVGPVSQGLVAANQANQLLGGGRQQTPQMMPMQHGQDSIGALLQQQQQLEEARRQLRAQQMGSLYGRVA